MKEYKLLFKYENADSSYTTRKEHTKCLGILNDVISDGKGCEFLDFSMIKDKVEEILSFVKLYQRYLALSKDSNGSLSYNNDGFNLDGHSFETLDEVDRALKNKAFL